MARQFDIRLGLDGRVMESVINTLGAKVGQWARRMGGLFAVGSLTAFTKSLLDNAGRIKDLSDRTGLSTTRIQEFGFAAKQAGSDIETVATVVSKLNKSLTEAVRDPKGDIAKAFQRMGVTAKTADEAFLQIAKHVQKVGDAGKVTSDVLEVMGKSGTELIPAMAEGFAETAMQAKQLGNVISEDVIASLARTGDELDVLKGKWTTLSSQIAAISIWSAETVWRATKKTWSDLAAGTTGGPKGMITAVRSFVENLSKEGIAIHEETIAQLSADRKSVV